MYIITTRQLCVNRVLNVIILGSDMYTIHLHFHLDVWYWEIYKYI